MKKKDDGCICEGNWRDIVKESRHLFGRNFKDTRTGETLWFFGLVHADDDYYYGFNSKTKGLTLLSCVGNLESWGMELVEAEGGG